MSKQPAEWLTPEVERLFEVILSLKTVEGCQKFFRDSLTLQEIQRVAKRWQIVEMLNQGMKYRDIAQKVGVSTATVTRVSYWFWHGEGGWRMALEQIKKRDSKHGKGEKRMMAKNSQNITKHRL